MTINFVHVKEEETNNFLTELFAFLHMLQRCPLCFSTTTNSLSNSLSGPSILSRGSLLIATVSFSFPSDFQQLLPFTNKQPKTFIYLLFVCGLQVVCCLFGFCLVYIKIRTKREQQQR